MLVIAGALFLVGLAVLIFASPRQADAFLRLFASSARAHYTEQVLRLLAGIGLILYAPHAAWASAFGILGWALIISSALLLILPWRLHQSFGERVIPAVIRYKIIYATGSLLLGTLVLIGMAIPFLT